MDLYNPHMVPHTIPWGIIIFQGVPTKLNFLTKFPHLEKFIDLMKDLKYEHQSILSLWGGSKLILGTGRENHLYFLWTPATVNFFHQIVKKLHFDIKNIITHPDGFV